MSSYSLDIQERLGRMGNRERRDKSCIVIREIKESMLLNELLIN